MVSGNLGSIRQATDGGIDGQRAYAIWTARDAHLRVTLPYKTREHRAPRAGWNQQVETPALAGNADF